MNRKKGNSKKKKSNGRTLDWTVEESEKTTQFNEKITDIDEVQRVRLPKNNNNFTRIMSNQFYRTDRFL